MFWKTGELSRMALTSSLLLSQRQCHYRHHTTCFLAVLTSENFRLDDFISLCRSFVFAWTFASQSFSGTWPPTDHAGMVLVICAQLLRGSKVVILPKFEFSKFLAAIERYKVTHAQLVPPIFNALTRSPLAEKYDLSSLEFIGVGAAPVPKDTLIACSQRYKRVFLRQVRVLHKISSPAPIMCNLALQMTLPSSESLTCYASGFGCVHTPDHNSKMFWVFGIVRLIIIRRCFGHLGLFIEWQLMLLAQKSIFTLARCWICLGFPCFTRFSTQFGSSRHPRQKASIAGHLFSQNDSLISVFSSGLGSDRIDRHWHKHTSIWLKWPTLWICRSASSEHGRNDSGFGDWKTAAT